jgi:porin
VTRISLLTVLIALTWSQLTLAQSEENPAPTEGAAPPTTTAPTSQPAAMPSLIQKMPDYTGDLAHRKYLTGDWGGARTDLANKGIFFDTDVTQLLQGNAHGGRDTTNAFRYSGSADYTLKLDTARMGLWPGGLFTLHGETKIGDNINPKVGSLMAPNYQGLFPVPNDPGTTTLSEFYVMQALSEKFVLMAGKVDATAIADQNAFASNQRTQFMNTGLRINPVLFYGAPYTSMAAGAVWLPTKWLQITTAVADNDPDGGATMTGFNTAFHGRDWETVLQEYAFTIKPFNKTGHQRLGWF